jgi:hypothetical protein
MSIYADPDTLHTLGRRRDTRNQLIGLSGFAQVGKDEVANILVKEKGFTRIALADPIREALYALDPMLTADSYGRPFRLQEVINDLGWDSAKTDIPEVRRLLQVLGTEVGRKLLGEHVWLDLAYKKLVRPGRYVITDVRFAGEADAVRAWGGSLVKIVRPGSGPVNAHISDEGLPDSTFDRVLLNDRSLVELRDRVLQMVKGL